MKDELVILILESKEMFDLMKPVLSKKLNTTRFIHCPTHQEAMTYMDSDQRADMVFADWAMADFSFIDKVRSDLENHNTPIIIMSEDVTNKKIVLNKTENKSTYFLSKPFLDKGLIKKVKKVLKHLERRRSTRIHPHGDYSILVKCKDETVFQLPLVDISISACLLRLPIELSRKITIYDKCNLEIEIDEFKIELLGELSRIGHDRPVPEDHSTVLIMVKFIETQPDRIEHFQDMLDRLYLRW